MKPRPVQTKKVQCSFQSTSVQVCEVASHFGGENVCSFMQGKLCFPLVLEMEGLRVLQKFLVGCIGLLWGQRACANWLHLKPDLQEHWVGHIQTSLFGSVCTAFKGLILCFESQMSSRTAITEQTIDSEETREEEDAKEFGGCSG